MIKETDDLHLTMGMEHIARMLYEAKGVIKGMVKYAECNDPGMPYLEGARKWLRDMGDES